MARVFGEALELLFFIGLSMLPWWAHGLLWLLGFA